MGHEPSSKFREGDRDMHILLTETSPLEWNACHACGVVLGGALFSYGEFGWEAVVETPLIEHVGGFGEAPDGELIKVGPDEHGVQFRTRDVGIGVSSRRCTSSWRRAMRISPSHSTLSPGKQLVRLRRRVPVLRVAIRRQL
jgi:hypothetical protein